MYMHVDVIGDCFFLLGRRYWASPASGTIIAVMDLFIVIGGDGKNIFKVQFDVTATHAERTDGRERRRHRPNADNFCHEHSSSIWRST